MSTEFFDFGGLLTDALSVGLKEKLPHYSFLFPETPGLFSFLIIDYLKCQCQVSLSPWDQHKAMVPLKFVGLVVCVNLNVSF